jgi:hypothetical protein
MKIKKRPLIFLTFFLFSFNWTYAFVNRRSSHALEHLPNTYYVKFASSPFTSSSEHVDLQHSNFHESLKKLEISAKVGHAFKRYANGIVVETDARHVKRIAEIEHVESIEPVVSVSKSLATMA